MNIILCLGRLFGGGAERVAALWVQGFVERGHKVTIIVGQGLKENSYSIPSNVNIITLPQYGNYKQLRFLLYVNKLRGYFKEIKPQVVITVFEPWAWMSWLASKGLSVPVIKTDHNAYEWPKEAEERFPRFHIFDKLYTNKLYNRVTVLTQADVDCMRGRLSNLTVLPNPLFCIPVNSVPTKNKIVLAAGRLNGWYVKGFDLLIEAWGRICSQYPDWQLWLAGNGAERDFEFLNVIAEKAGVGNQIKFLGFCHDMKSIYQESSIFVLSSRYEGFGMVLTEAMSQGCACIACDWKGRQREIVEDGKDGLICPVNDSYSLAEKIKFLISDEGKRLIIQRNAIEKSQKFSLDRIMDRWEQIFAELNISLD